MGIYINQIFLGVHASRLSRQFMFHPLAITYFPIKYHNRSYSPPPLLKNPQQVKITLLLEKMLTVLYNSESSVFREIYHKLLLKLASSFVITTSVNSGSPFLCYCV